MLEAHFVYIVLYFKRNFVFSFSSTIFKWHVLKVLNLYMSLNIWLTGINRLRKEQKPWELHCHHLNVTNPILKI